MNLAIEVSKDGGATLIVFPATLMKSIWVQTTIEKAIKTLHKNHAALFIHIPDVTNKDCRYEEVLGVQDKRALVEAINDVAICGEG